MTLCWENLRFKSYFSLKSEIHQALNWRFMQWCVCWLRSWEVCTTPGFASAVQAGSAEARLFPLPPGVLESKTWQLPSKADSTSKFKKEKRSASLSSEHEHWETHKISLTGRSKQLICSQSKHSSSQGSAKQRAETPLSFAFFSPHTCSLKEQRKLKSLSFFPFFSLTKGDSGSVQQGSSPSPRSIF